LEIEQKKTATAQFDVISGDMSRGTRWKTKISQKMAGTTPRISTPNLPNKEQKPHFLDVNAGNNELQTERDRGAETGYVLLHHGVTCPMKKMATNKTSVCHPQKNS
jgi:hypothetical protein